MPRRPEPRPAAGARAAAGGGARRGRDVLRRPSADVVVGFGGYVAAPAYLAARRLHVPFVVHEANARPGLANRLGARFTPYVADDVPGTPLPHGALRRDAAAAGGRRTWTGPPAGPRRAAAFGLDPDRPTLLVTGGSQGARRLNEAAVRRRRGAARCRASRCCTWRARRNAVDASDRRAAATRRTSSCPTSSAWSSPTPPPTWCSAAPAPRPCAELAAVGLPAVYVPLPIGNGEQRLNARPVVDAGGGLLVDDAALHARLGRATVAAPLLLDTERLAAMGRGGAALRSARRRRAAGRPGRSRPRASGGGGTRDRADAATRCPRRPGPRALRRHRRRRHVRHRADHARPRRHRCRGSDAKDSRELAALRALGADVHVGHDAAHVGDAPTRSSCPPPSATATSSWSRRGRAGLRVLHRAEALAAVMAGRRGVAVAGTHGKTTTTSMLTVALQHCGADPSFAIGGQPQRVRRQRPPRHAATSSSPRPTRATARSCSPARRSPSSPTSSPTTSTTTGTPRPIATRSWPSPAASGRAVTW